MVGNSQNSIGTSKKALEKACGPKNTKFFLASLPQTPQKKVV